MTEFSNLSLLKLLRSVDILSRLPILQLSHIADSLSQLSFSDGQTIVDKVYFVSKFECLFQFLLFHFLLTIRLQSEDLLGVYIIQKGVVKITCDVDSAKNVNAPSIIPPSDNHYDDITNESLSVEKTEGSYFGEWKLLGEDISPFRVVAVGDVVCSVLTREKFDAVVGPLARSSQDDQKYALSFCILIK